MIHVQLANIVWNAWLMLFTFTTIQLVSRPIWKNLQPNSFYITLTRRFIEHMLSTADWELHCHWRNIQNSNLYWLEDTFYAFFLCCWAEAMFSYVFVFVCVRFSIPFSFLSCAICFFTFCLFSIGNSSKYNKP